MCVYYAVSAMLKKGAFYYCLQATTVCCCCVNKLYVYYFVMAMDDPLNVWTVRLLIGGMQNVVVL